MLFGACNDRFVESKVAIIVLTGVSPKLVSVVALASIRGFVQETGWRTTIICRDLSLLKRKELHWLEGRRGNNDIVKVVCGLVPFLTFGGAYPVR